jgi:capsular exopolysaccharide synthesis family protein
LLLGLLITLLTTPLYTASATLEIQREAPNFAEVKQGNQAQGAIDNEFYQTQYGLLRSRALAERVAQSLRLGDSPAFFEQFDVTAPEGWFQNGRPVQTGAARQARVRAAGAIVLERVTVEPERMSRLIEVRFTSPDPQLSKRVIDTWSANFIQTTLERRYAATTYARQFLEDRLGQLRVRIDQSERALVNYASRENIINIPSPSGAPGEAGERSLVADDLVNLNRELAQATAERVQTESRLQSGSNVKEVLDNATSNSLRTRRAELAAEYARLMQQFDPGYPPARAVQAQIASIDAASRGEVGRVSGVLRENYEAALARERTLSSEVNRLTGRVLDFRRRSIQYNILQREVDTNRQLYDALLQRYKEIGVAGGVGVNNISVVDNAELPERPSSPRLLFNLAAALLAGLVLGAGMALLFEQIDEGITDPIEVEQLLGLPLVGVTPKLAGETPVEALNDPKSALTEAYASVAANLGFATSHGVPRTLAITSARAAEGKSSTSYALARSLARANRRVVLVDADMRSPSVHHLVGIPLDRGLSNYLAGLDELDQLLRPTSMDRLSVITAGPQPPSTPELLNGDRLGRLLEQLGQNFDHVVLDLPPVMGLADAPLIASQVEGTLMVTAAHSTHKNVARLAVGRLRTAHAHILGVVLSMFDAKQASYGYGYGYGYGSGYGYGDSDKKA